MKDTFITLAILAVFGISSAQETTKISFNGLVEPSEWDAAERFSIAYEIDPGNNTPSPNKTDVYVTYDDEHILVGFIAYADMNTLRSSVRNRS